MEIDWSSSLIIFAIIVVIYIIYVLYIGWKDDKELRELQAKKHDQRFYSIN